MLRPRLRATTVLPVVATALVILASPTLSFVLPLRAATPTTTAAATATCLFCTQADYSCRSLSSCGERRIRRGNDASVCMLATTTGAGTGAAEGRRTVGGEAGSEATAREDQRQQRGEVKDNYNNSEAAAADEKPLPLDKALEEGVNRAMRGDPNILRQILSQEAEWLGPMGRNLGTAAIEAEFRGVGQLLSEPRLTVIESKNGARELEWIASGTWPLPWLPRFIVRGTSSVTTGSHGKIVKITDTWEGNLLSLALKHLVPGFWDIWHQLGSPPAEQQPYTVVQKSVGYEIREYAPRLISRPSLIDRSNSRELRMALILPGFCHTGELRTSGRKPDEYYVTAPIEVTIQPFIETGNFPNGTWFNGTVREASTSRRANRITWSVPVPTAFGLDATSLPPAAKNPNPDNGEEASIVRQGFRRMAVAPFNGLPQDPEAAIVRKELLARLQKNGIEATKGSDGRVLNGILMHNSRACFDKKGRLAMSILYYRPPWLGIGNEVFVEVGGGRG